jgi:hypothetical protein
MAKGVKHKATLDKEAAREVLRARVTANMGPMIDAQIQHAKGLSYLVYRDKKAGKFVTVTAENLEDAQKENTVEVWSKDPSVQAFTDLMNRALDKPAEQPQAVEIEGEVLLRWAE